MAGISLDLSTPPTQTTQTDAEAMPTDPLAIRWALVQLLWARGLSRTARVLAQELEAQSDPEWSHRAGQWLNERH
jgi:kynurenine formamidase